MAKGLHRTLVEQPVAAFGTYLITAPLSVPTQANESPMPIVEAWPQFGGKSISTAISQPPAPNNQQAIA
jgi:hypothetical protein